MSRSGKRSTNERYDEVPSLLQAPVKEINQSVLVSNAIIFGINIEPPINITTASPIICRKYIPVPNPKCAYASKPTHSG